MAAFAPVAVLEMETNMKKTKQSVLSTVGAMVAVCYLIGCGGSVSQPKGPLRQTGPDKWIVSLKKGGQLDVTCVVFPPSSHTVTICQQRQEETRAYLEELEEDANSAPTEALRKSDEEEIVLYRDELFGYAGGWKGWPYVTVQPVLTAEAGNPYTIVITYSDRWKKDVVFLAYSSTPVTHKEVVDSVRLLTNTLDAMSTWQFGFIAVEAKPVYDERGAFQSPRIKEFAKKAVFPAQH